MKTRDWAYRTASRLLPALLLSAFFSCTKPDDFSLNRSDPAGGTVHRDFSIAHEFDRVVLLYAEGHNNLGKYLRQNIDDLCQGYIPPDPSDALLVFSKLPLRDERYSDPVEPVLMRIRRGQDGKAVRDTLLKYPPRTVAASAETMSSVFSYVQEHYPAKHYGVIMSSHASGWLPVGYFNGFAAYEGSDVISWAMRRRAGEPVPAGEGYPGYYTGPLVRSYGMDKIISGGQSHEYEMTIREVAASIPIHLDFLQFDTCLMGCVEVAYELKDVTDLIGFSPAEVLAEGLDYKTVAAHLFQGESFDIQSVCKDYFDSYNSKSDGDYRSATISLVDCTKMDALAAGCRTLFDAYREQIMALNPDDVQRYYRYGRYYFYDLQDILLRAGISETERQSLQRLLDDCVVYKAATPSFMGAFDIDVYSGLSMYLPSIATYHPKKDFTFLNNFYRTEISWNEATGLVP